jgi:hypothetical protein
MVIPSPNENPYAAPASAAIPAARQFGGRTRCAWIALALAVILPLLILWESASSDGLLPHLLPAPGNIVVDIAVWVTLLVLTMASVPLGFLGVRSRRTEVALIAMLLGIAGASVILWVKFIPVLGLP